MARLEAYAALLRRWNRRSIWWRPAPFPMSGAAICSTRPSCCRYLPAKPCLLADLGSGAGFPGLVLAIMGAGEVELVEADGRKCAFLREAMRVSGAAARVREGRIEVGTARRFAVVTARALAPLAKLLG